VSKGLTSQQFDGQKSGKKMHGSRFKVGRMTSSKRLELAIFKHRHFTR